MTREDIIRMAQEADEHADLVTAENALLNWYEVRDERFAALVASAEREKARAEIDALYEMYKLVCSQRDELMDEHRAQVAALRGRMQ